MSVIAKTPGAVTAEDAATAKTAAAFISANKGAIAKGTEHAAELVQGVVQGSSANSNHPQSQQQPAPVQQPKVDSGGSGGGGPN